jgi:hypothetical protein
VGWGVCRGVGWGGVLQRRWDVEHGCGVVLLRCGCGVDDAMHPVLAVCTSCCMLLCCWCAGLVCCCVCCRGLPATAGLIQWPWQMRHEGALTACCYACGLSFKWHRGQPLLR